MNDMAREYRDEAREWRDNGQITKAGDFYTAAGHEYAGSVTEHTFPNPDSTRFAVSALCYAATCYRIAGDEFRLQNRCDQAILLAEDYIEFIQRQQFDDGTFADLRRGAWQEFIGDVRTIARRETASEAYDEAIEIYRGAGEWEFAFAEEEHTCLAAYFRSLRRGLGEEIPETAPEQEAFDVSFPEWVEYKRERLPDMLDALVEQGTWPWEPS